jgi:hypothetical protein
MSTIGDICPASVQMSNRFLVPRNDRIFFNPIFKKARHDENFYMEVIALVVWCLTTTVDFLLVGQQLIEKMVFN